MRDFLDTILEFIGSESLTDEEFETVTLEDEEYTKEVYLALRTILEARETVSGEVKRLKLYFIARNVDISDAPSVPTPNSNILIGKAL
jgi:hypothetical protein